MKAFSPGSGLVCLFSILLCIGCRESAVETNNWWTSTQVPWPPDRNYYWTRDKHPEYGVVSLYVSNCERITATALLIDSMQQCRATYGKAYVAGSLRRWSDNDKRSTPFRPKMVVFFFDCEGEPDEYGYVIPAELVFEGKDRWDDEVPTLFRLGRMRPPDDSRDPSRMFDLQLISEYERSLGTEQTHD